MSKFDAKKYVTKNLSEDTVNKLRECFNIFDYDGSGNISAEELINTIRALGIEGQAQQILSIVQASSHAEEMDFAGFLEVFGFSGDGTSEASIGQLFEYFDINKQGSFGPEQFEKVAQSVGQNFSASEIDQMVNYADSNRDGAIDFEEFNNVVSKPYPKV